MADKLPFDEDVMTLIMGLGGPEEPGQHGRTQAPMPEKKAIDIITEIRDLCEEFLQMADKGEEKPEKPGKEEESEEDMESEEE